MITLTQNALTEIRSRLRKLASGHRTVRIGTKPGGCAGTKYTVEVGAEPRPGDRHWDQEDVRIVCAAEHAGSVMGLVVDHAAGLKGGGFCFENPSAASTCGCGSSFRPLQNLF